MAFAIQAEGMDEKEFDDFTRNLPFEPGAPKRTRGSRDLMALMGGGGRVPDPAPVAREGSKP